MAVVFLGMYLAEAVYDIPLRTSGPLQTISSAEYTMTLADYQLRLSLFEVPEAREFAFLFGGQEYRLLAIPNLFR